MTDQTTEQAAVEQYLKDKHEEYMQGGKYDEFAESLYSKMSKYGLSDKQTAAIMGRIKRDAQFAAEKATAADCPTGQTDVIGIVVSCKWKHNKFGGGYKMIVKADTGYCVYSSVPAALAVTTDEHAAALKGQQVRYNATVTPSDTDPKFGFAKRPQAATVLAVIA